MSDVKDAAAAASSVHSPTRVDVRPIPEAIVIETHDTPMASPVAVDDHALQPTAASPSASDWRTCVQNRVRLMYLYLRDRTSPTRLRAAWRPKHTHIAVQAVYSFLTVLLFLLLYYFNGFAGHVSGYGVPQDITCHSIGWGGCGINGGDCQPFDQAQWSPLRCPHRCTLLKTSGTVVGGRNGIYKADSHICNSALHAGVIDDSTGGCFLYRPSGVQDTFFSGGTRASISSLSFPSWFPGSMTFASVDSSYCSNYAVAILVVGIVWLLGLALIRPNALLLWLLMLYWGFWYCTLTLTDSATQRQLFWNANANCLVLAVGGYVLFHLSPKHTLYVTPEYAAASPNQWPWKIFTQTERLFCKRKRVHSHPASRGAASAGGPAVVSVGLASVSSSSSERANESLRQSRSDSRSLHAPLVAVSDPSMSPSPSPSPSGGPSESPPATSVYYSPPRPRDMQESGLASPSALVTLAALPPPLVVDRSAAAAAAAKPAPSVSNGGLVLRPWYDLYFLYILPMIAAFHFTYLVYVPQISDIDLDSQFFSHGTAGAILIVCFILVIGATVIYHMAMAWRINILCQYLLYYTYVLMGVIFVSALFFASASFHLHHYLAGMLLVPMSRFPSRISLVFQAIAAGIMVNGLAVWGLDAAWDVSSAVPSFNRARNPPPQVFPIANATTNSLFIAWEVEGQYSDAIGSTLMLNGIEIYHSTFVDTTYGGGFTPFNSSAAAALTAATPAGASVELTAPGSPAPSQGMAILSVRPRNTGRLKSMARHTPSAPSSSLLSLLSHSNSLHVELSSPHSPPRLALPSYSLSRVDRSRTAHRAASKVQPRLTSDLSDPLVTSEHADALTSMLTASTATPLQRLTQFYYIFQLVNLRPNTSYLLSAGYIEPQGIPNYGRTIIIRTAQGPQ